MNIQISSSTSTQSSNEEIDERNDEPSMPPGVNTRPGRNDQHHASSEALRKPAITGKYAADLSWMMYTSHLLPFCLFPASLSQFFFDTSTGNMHHQTRTCSGLKNGTTRLQPLHRVLPRRGNRISGRRRSMSTPFSSSVQGNIIHTRLRQQTEGNVEKSSRRNFTHLPAL